MLNCNPKFLFPNPYFPIGLQIQSSKTNMPRKLDPFWEYGEPKALNDRQNLNCKLCGKEIRGGGVQVEVSQPKTMKNNVLKQGKQKKK